MNWGNLSDFLAMGGYAFYVWGSYGVTFGLIIVEIFLLRSRRRAVLEQLGSSAMRGRT